MVRKTFDSVLPLITSLVDELSCQGFRIECHNELGDEHAIRVCNDVDYPYLLSCEISRLSAIARTYDISWYIGTFSDGLVIYFH